VWLEGFTARGGGSAQPLIVQKSDGGYMYATTDLAAVRHRVDPRLVSPIVGGGGEGGGEGGGGAIEQAEAGNSSSSSSGGGSSGGSSGSSGGGDNGSGSGSCFVGLGADRALYVTDAGQAEHFAQVFQVAKRAGFVPPTATLEHVPFGVVQVKGAKGRKCVGGGRGWGGGAAATPQSFRRFFLFPELKHYCGSCCLLQTHLPLLLSCCYCGTDRFFFSLSLSLLLASKNGGRGRTGASSRRGRATRCD